LDAHSASNSCGRQIASLQGSGLMSAADISAISDESDPSKNKAVGAV
jgi:hypothetical protein